ncbi:MAG TPA: HEAT repeat domain-containing protein [Gemmata sp.]|nr:HEAT repeat domain-containing protein [Gemmata sp.]
MKWVWRTGVAAVGFLLATELAVGQVPGGMPAGAPGAAAPGVPGAPAAAPAAAPQGFFAKLCAACAACKQKICASPAGQMLNNMTKPLSFATGGIIPPFCPLMPTAQDLAQPGVAGASDAIKKDALEAQMRREKVRFLGTVDCRYYPDAIVALTAALRSDGSECVRYEAALALSHGCCCNQKTIDALEASVSGTEKDGNPAERSVRVRCVAAIGLERCLSCYMPPPVEKDNVEVKPELKSPETLPNDPGPGIKKLNGDAPPALLKLPDDANSKKTGKNVPNPDNQKPTRESIMAAWRTLNEFNALLEASRARIAAQSGDRSSVYSIIKNTAPPSESPVMQTSVAVTQTPPLPQGSQPASTPSRASLGQPKTDSTPISVSPPIVGQSAPSYPPATDPLATTPVVSSPKALPSNVPSSPIEEQPEPKIAAPATPASSSAVASQPANPIMPVINQMLYASTPMDRHTAIRQVMRFDWQKNPVIMSALLAGAKSDTSPAVRVDCLRHLAVHHMTHPQVIAELAPLTQDSDPWVRDEAVKALAQLKEPR